MARQQRLFIENMSYHILLNSLEDFNVFEKKVDKDFFLQLVSEYSTNYNLEIHSYSLTNNFFEFLATPRSLDSIPKFMQSLARLYVNYYNKKYDRSGTLWKGRYKASLIDAKFYLFPVMSFIERISNSSFSSKDKNLFDKKDNIVVYHEMYKNLGYTQKDRIKAYESYFKSSSIKMDEFILNSIEKQSITASRDFINALENRLGTTLQKKKRGRPKKIIRDKKMFKNLQVLDKENHKNLKILPYSNLFFARDLSTIPVMINEVNMLSNIFPIVFTKDETPSLISLVSIGNGNLAITPEGKWIGNYVPYTLRKYPFSMASVKDKPEQKIIMIDEGSDLVSNIEGESLFSEDNTQTEFLEKAISFLSESEKHVAATKEIVDIIAKSGILEDREISVGEGEEKKVLVSGFKVINKDKLYELSDDILASWVRRGIISFIDLHIKSLDKINLLFELANKRQN